MHGLVDKLVDAYVSLLEIGRSHSPDAYSSVNATRQQKWPWLQILEASDDISVYKEESLQLRTLIVPNGNLTVD